MKCFQFRTMFMYVICESHRTSHDMRISDGVICHSVENSLFAVTCAVMRFGSTYVRDVRLQPFHLVMQTFQEYFQLHQLD